MNRAGNLIRKRARAQSTGYIVTLYDTSHPDSVFDPNGGRWVTVCEEHHTVCNHTSIETALRFTATPELWCEACGDEVAP